MWREKEDRCQEGEMETEQQKRGNKSAKGKKKCTERAGERNEDDVKRK